MMAPTYEIVAVETDGRRHEPQTWDAKSAEFYVNHALRTWSWGSFWSRLEIRDPTGQLVRIKPRGK